LGTLQHFHKIHHSTHRNNFFFATGLIWDVLFRTLRTERPDSGRNAAA
jgi:sterol desaturase/sphingolipid hydroxylase (fatty acid hydroxylase superfamily)